MIIGDFLWGTLLLLRAWLWGLRPRFHPGEKHQKAIWNSQGLFLLLWRVFRVLPSPIPVWLWGLGECSALLQRDLNWKHLSICPINTYPVPGGRHCPRYWSKAVNKARPAFKEPAFSLAGRSHNHQTERWQWVPTHPTLMASALRTLRRQALSLSLFHREGNWGTERLTITHPGSHQCWWHSSPGCLPPGFMNIVPSCLPVKKWPDLFISTWIEK